MFHSQDIEIYIALMNPQTWLGHRHYYLLKYTILIVSQESQIALK